MKNAEQLQEILHKFYGRILNDVAIEEILLAVQEDDLEAQAEAELAPASAPKATATRKTNAK